MDRRPFRRAAAASLAATLVFAGAVSADSVRADGDMLTPAIDGVVDLGQVGPSEELSVDVGFVLGCTGFAHPDPGQTVTLAETGVQAPSGGAFLGVTPGTLGPVPADWTADGDGCPFPAPTFDDGTPSVVTLRAPATPGAGYTYTVFYERTLSPVGNDDGGAFGVLTALDLVLEVVGNTPPVVDVPGATVVEGDATRGWTADWSAVGATDVEDDPDPTPSCFPAAGTVLPLGTTAVTCSVTDTGGRTDRGLFDVTVVDTTAPVLVGMPAGQVVTTAEPTGTTLAYDPPSATDVVDPAPSVACAPAPGDHVGPGTTSVTCTATDASRNAVSATFDVVVSHVAAQTAAATWLEPVGGKGVFVANRGRSVPVKVQLFVDGVERPSGDAGLSLVACTGGDPRMVDLVYSGGRWNASLDTAPLAGSCYTVSAAIDGLVAGAFTLELRGTEAAKTGAKTGARTRTSRR